MTDSVWWYVLAGFLLGFILSTLWEWLYFRRRRMQIENERIAELEATVRSLSTVSQSVEANTSPGFAAGYQSPMVFLEGEDDDVDTVEVIVPNSPEPVDFDQSITSQTVPVEQSRSDTQFVAAKAEPSSRTQFSNGNGVPGQAPKMEPAAVAAVRVEPPIEPTQSTLSPAALAAGTAAAAAIWASEKDRPTVSPDAQGEPVVEAPPAEAAAADLPVADIPIAEPLVAETIVYGDPAWQAAEEQEDQEPVAGLVGDLAPSRQINYVNTLPDEEEIRIQEGAAPQTDASSTAEIQTIPPETRGAAVSAAAVIADRPPVEPAESAAADSTAQVTIQPVAQPPETQHAAEPPVPPQAVPAQPERQKSEEDSGLSPAGVAVLVSALASKLAGEERRPPEAAQQGASVQPLQAEPQAEPQAAVSQAEAPEPPAVTESAPDARVMPVVYDLPDTPDDTENAPLDQAAVTNPGLEQKTDPVAQPADVTQAPGVEKAVDPGGAPQSTLEQGQEAPLPLSAILPRAANPAPLSKSGPAKRPETAQASTLAAPGIEPEIEQVSNQLDDLIESINGLIERTQPLLDQPSQTEAVTAERSAAPAPIFADGDGEEPGTDEGANSGVTGPYSAQNLSRMEYGLVQLMQAARRLGKDVRSAF